MLQKTTEIRLRELEKVIMKEQDRMFRFAYMRVGNRTDAEDILQDVFLKLFCSGESFTHVRSMRNYLFRTISNSCMDYHRKKHSYPISVEESRIEDMPQEDRQIHDEYLRISRQMKALPEEQAEILRLRFSDGLKFREIAKLLDIPIATAKSRYRYAVSRIQKNINF